MKKFKVSFWQSPPVTVSAWAFEVLPSGGVMFKSMVGPIAYFHAVKSVEVFGK